MRKITILALVILLTSGVAGAQKYGRFRPKYTNIGYSIPTLSIDNSSRDLLKSNVGVGFTTGRSYILHPKPIAGMIRIGIDATWVDLNYANYKYQGPGAALLEDKPHIHQAEVGVGFGPSVHVSPIADLGVHAYFRFNPSFSALIDNSDRDDLVVMGGYTSFFVAGGAVSWRFISLGAEARWGSGKYTRIKGGDEDDDSLIDISEKYRAKTGGMRVYLSFRF